jgi:hypothetical protein
VSVVLLPASVPLAGFLGTQEDAESSASRIDNLKIGVLVRLKLNSPPETYRRSVKLSPVWLDRFLTVEQQD